MIDKNYLVEKLCTFNPPYSYYHTTLISTPPASSFSDVVNKMSSDSSSSSIDPTCITLGRGEILRQAGLVLTQQYPDSSTQHPISTTIRAAVDAAVQQCDQRMILRRPEHATPASASSSLSSDLTYITLGRGEILRQAGLRLTRRYPEWSTEHPISTTVRAAVDAAVQQSDQRMTLLRPDHATAEYFAARQAWLRREVAEARSSLALEKSDPAPTGSPLFRDSTTPQDGPSSPISRKL